jgi:predicted RNase H-like nuclease
VEAKHKTREMGRVLGIDIGYSKRKKTTGVCLLSWNDSSIHVKFKNLPTDTQARRNALNNLIEREGTVCCAALDAPIRGNFDVINEYRDAEKFLTRKLQKYVGKPGQASSGNGISLNISANSFAQLLLDLEVVDRANHLARIHEKCIVEAFPTSFLGVLLPKSNIPRPGSRSDIYFEQLLGPDSPRPEPLPSNVIVDLLSRLLPTRSLGTNLSAIFDHEERAAFVCAITALCVVQRQYVAVGDKRNGYIILPPLETKGAPGMQGWALDLIRGNAPQRNNSIIIEPGRLE